MVRFSKNNCPKNTHTLTEKNNCVKNCANGKERGSLTKRCKIQCPKRTHELTEKGNCVKRCVNGKTRNQSSKRKRCKQINNARTNTTYDSENEPIGNLMHRIKKTRTKKARSPSPPP